MYPNRSRSIFRIYSQCLAGCAEQRRAPQGFVLWAGPPLGEQPMWSIVGIRGRTPTMLHLFNLIDGSVRWEFTSLDLFISKIGIVHTLCFHPLFNRWLAPSLIVGVYWLATCHKTTWDDDWRALEVNTNDNDLYWFRPLNSVIPKLSDPKIPILGCE